MTALASGDDPEKMGIDLLKILAYAPTWEEAANTLRDPDLPRVSDIDRVHRRVKDAVARVSLPRLAGILARGRPRSLLSGATLRSLRHLRGLQRRTRRLPKAPPTGVRE